MLWLFLLEKPSRNTLAILTVRQNVTNFLAMHNIFNEKGIFQYIFQKEVFI